MRQKYMYLVVYSFLVYVMVVDNKTDHIELTTRNKLGETQYSKIVCRYLGTEI